MQPYNPIKYLSRNSTAFRYGIAVAISLAAIALRILMQPIVSYKFPYASLFLAVLIAARFGGFGPALLSIVLNLFGAILFLIDWSKHELSDYVGLIIFVLISCTMAYVVGRFRFLAYALAEQKEQLQATLQQLVETNTRNSAIVETALDCIISINHEGKIIEFNPAAEKTFGYKRTDVLGKKIEHLIIPPSYCEEYHIGFEKHLRTGEGRYLNKRIEVNALRSDGTEFPVELSIAPIVYADRLPTFTAHLRDIQNEKRLQQRRDVRVAINQALASSLTSQNPVFDVIRALSQILGCQTATYWEVDQVNNVLACHTQFLEAPELMQDFAAATRRLRCSPGQGLPGRIWEGRVSAVITDLSGDDNFLRPESAVKAGLKSAFGVPLLVEHQVIGIIEFCSCERHTPDADLLELLSTVGLQLGQLIERRRIVSSLRKSEARFTHFMNQLPGLAWIKDQDGRYVYANSAAINAFGVPTEKLYGKTDFEIFPTSTASQFTSNDAQAAETLEGISVVETLEDKTGRLRHSLVSKFPMKGDKEGEYFIGGMAIDITERLNAEEALKESDRRKNKFMAMLGHELRNPLAPIRNALELVTQSADPETFGWAKDIISRHLQHIVRLVDDLLDISRIIRGKILLQLSDVELQPVIQHAIEEVQFDLDQKQHRLSVSVPSEQIWLRADAVRLTQILSNLLTNAIKYTDTQGTISLSAVSNERSVEIRVSDSGIGIEPHLLETIFIPFTQLTSSIDRSSGGLGIGLALVRRLVELHNGTIRASSEGKGKGCEFICEFPTVSQPHRLADAPWTPEIIAPRRVLVVDDNRGSAITLCKLLEKFWGHTVECVYSGLEVFDKAKDYKPEVIFLDIGLPGLNGYEVATNLKADRTLQNIILVALTGYGQSEDRQKSEEVGFYRHWVKPVSVTTLQTFFQELDARLK